MGILNITPDSFSDGGALYDSAPLLDRILFRAESMLEQGADILDIGGESTRPGATPVDEAEERDRVLPVVEAIRQRMDCPLSVDTSTPSVMRDAINLGVEMINDVRALQRPGAVEAVAQSQVFVCLMHSSGEPGEMQDRVQYRHVTKEVLEFLRNRIDICQKQGIAQKRICIDPGFGFGKTLEQNLQLLVDLPRFKPFKMPILVGLSRKSMVGAITGRDVEDRLAGSLSLAYAALEQGASILRVHDVEPSSDMLKVWLAIKEQNKKNDDA